MIGYSDRKPPLFNIQCPTPNNQRSREGPGDALAEGGEGFVAEGAGEVEEQEAGAAGLAGEGDLARDLGGEAHGKWF